MKVLVVGGSGFVGARLVEALRARGDEVVVTGRSAARLGKQFGNGVQYLLRVSFTTKDKLGNLVPGREQQRVIVEILKCGQLRDTLSMDKEKWTALLQTAGLDEAAMHRWHKEFERMFPEEHQEFLQSLRIPREEIKLIRAWSKL